MSNRRTAPASAPKSIRAARAHERLLDLAIDTGNQDGAEAVAVYLREGGSIVEVEDWVGPARDAATHTFSLRNGASEQEIDAYYAAYADAAETAASEAAAEPKPEEEEETEE
jgi:hypothetical protein